MFEDMSTSIKNKNTSNLLTLPCAKTATAFLLYNLPDFVGDMSATIILLQKNRSINQPNQQIKIMSKQCS